MRRPVPSATEGTAAAGVPTVAVLDEGMFSLLVVVNMVTVPVVADVPRSPYCVLLMMCFILSLRLTVESAVQ